MTASIVVLKTPATDAHDSVIRVMKEMLARAERGEIVAFAAACVCSDTSTASYASCQTKLVALVGALSVVQAELVQDAISGSSELPTGDATL